MALAGMLAGLLAGAARGQQVADTLFTPDVSQPAWPAGTGPRVRIDEAHHNFHTAGDRYRVFADLLRRDGYRVGRQCSAFTPAGLDSTDVLVIANALAAVNDTSWTLPTPSAFTAAEVVAVREWVEGGGSLLLIADHMPFPGAAEAMAAAFGVAFINGFALRGNEGNFLYTRSNTDRLMNHAITGGRTAAEAVDSVTAFTGQAFRLIGEGDPLMVLGPGVRMLLPVEAWEFSDTTASTSAEGLLQGAVLRRGRGRAAVFAEAAEFTAQLAGPQQIPIGMNAPAARQNAQFILNVMHWLSGMLEGRGEDGRRPGQ